MCAGDFNEIAKSHEKYGGHLRLTKQMQDFQDIVDECSVMDLGFVGTKFTWYKNYPNGGTIWERLDREVGTKEWLSVFPATKVVVLKCVTSNHKSIIIHPLGIPMRR